MSPVVEYQKHYRVPLYCGELGVYRAFSPPRIALSLAGGRGQIPTSVDACPQ